jgi:isopentenyl-diphosphate delta-isomerase
LWVVIFMLADQIERRKEEHLKLCSEGDVCFKEKTTLLECVELPYESLPEINMSDVSLSTDFLGKKINFSFMASAITGGAQVSKKVNLDIANACEKFGAGMGLGSIRAMIENKRLKDTYYVRDVAPNIFLAANIGIAQVKELDPSEIIDAAETLGCDAIAVHLNSAQEAVQPEGDTDFSNLVEALKEFISNSSIPVYVKEVGHGMSERTLELLKDTGIKAIDVQGAGGTSWTAVDALRHPDGFGLAFREYGVPTALSILNTKKVFEYSPIPIIGSGGVWTGVEVAKCIALGATLGGAAMPVLRAQRANGVEGVEDYFALMEREMRIAYFLAGAKNAEELRTKNIKITGKLKELM